MEPRYAQRADGGRIAWDEVGPPEPEGAVLLLTGLGSKRLAWSRQLPVFGRRYRTIALDHRGVGDSDPALGPYAMADLADDAAGLLVSLGIPRAHVVGISLGGFVAMQVAIRHPDRVGALVLTSTTAGGPGHVMPSAEMLAMLGSFDPGVEPGAKAKARYAKILAPGFAETHPEELELVAEVARYRPQTAESYGLQIRAAMAHDASSELAGIRAPTLVVHGALDPLVPPENGAHLAARIPGATHLVYPEVGHVPIFEDAERYNRDVLAFLARVVSDPRGGVP